MLNQRQKDILSGKGIIAEAALLGDSWKWPSGLVPYVFSAGKGLSRSLFRQILRRD